MKLTVITTESGEVVAVQRGHASELRRNVEGAVVIAGPGQRLREIDVPDGDVDVDDPAALHRTVAHHLL